MVIIPYTFFATMHNNKGGIWLQDTKISLKPGGHGDMAVLIIVISKHHNFSARRVCTIPIGECNILIALEAYDSKTTLLIDSKLDHEI